MALFNGDLRRKTGRGDLVQHHRGFSIAVGRRDLSADPVGGAILLLFVIERVVFGMPPDPEAADPQHH